MRGSPRDISVERRRGPRGATSATPFRTRAPACLLDLRRRSTLVLLCQTEFRSLRRLCGDVTAARWFAWLRGVAGLWLTPRPRRDMPISPPPSYFMASTVETLAL